MQTRKQSLVEVGFNTFIGMVGSWLLMMLCMYIFTTPMAIATSSTILCTVWSLSRGYCVRRYFCDKETKMNKEN